MKKEFSATPEMRNRLAGAALAVTCIFGGAAHAGSPDPVIVEPVVTPPAALPDWAGPYVGGNIGYAFDASERVGHRNSSGVLVTGSAGELDISGFNYGLRLGWRGQKPLQGRSFVYGLELGYGGGDMKDSFATASYSASVDTNYILGLRAKSGVTNRAGDTLFYGILGYVHGDFDYAVKGTAASGDSIDLDRSYNTDGYALGLGVEHMLNERWSVNAEWEYVEFSSKQLYDGSGASTKATPKYHNIMVGVNYRF